MKNSRKIPLLQQSLELTSEVQQSQELANLVEGEEREEGLYQKLGKTAE